MRGNRWSRPVAAGLIALLCLLFLLYALDHLAGAQP